MNRLLRAALATAILLALLRGTSMMYAAWQHNPQGEFHELAADGTTIVHWFDWLLVGGSWFGATLGALCLAETILIGAAWVVRRLVRLTTHPVPRLQRRLDGHLLAGVDRPVINEHIRHPRLERIKARDVCRRALPVRPEPRR